MARIYTAAVIGCGAAGAPTALKGGGHQIGYTHAQALQDHPRFDLAAAADVSEPNLAAFAQRFEVGTRYGTMEELLERERPDVVTLGTYVGLHRPMIELAARYDVKGVLCEKPFLESPADLARIHTIAADSGIKIVVAHVRRCLPAFRYAKARYLDGSVGKPMMCLAGLDGWDLSEWGSHWLDMFRFFHDDQEVEWVFGQARVRDGRGYGHAMEEHGIAYFQFAGGGKALLDGGSGMAGPDTMVLLGTKGTIRIRDEAVVLIEGAEKNRRRNFANDPESQWMRCWHQLLTELVEWLDGGPEPELGHTNMLKTSELTLAAYMSAVRGDRIDLPLDTSLDEWPVELLARRTEVM
jgi:predicted dehydrogenase